MVRLTIKKCVEAAARMVEDCNVNEIALIHVHESAQLFPDYWQGKYPFTAEEKPQVNKLDKRVKEERKKIFIEALKLLEGKTLKPKPFLKLAIPLK